MCSGSIDFSRLLRFRLPMTMPTCCCCGRKGAARHKIIMISLLQSSMWLQVYSASHSWALTVSLHTLVRLLVTYRYDCAAPENALALCLLDGPAEEVEDKLTECLAIEKESADVWQGDGSRAILLNFRFRFVLGRRGVRPSLTESDSMCLTRVPTHFFFLSVALACCCSVPASTSCC